VDGSGRNSYRSPQRRIASDWTALYVQAHRPSSRVVRAALRPGGSGTVPIEIIVVNARAEGIEGRLEWRYSWRRSWPFRRS